MSGWLKTAEEKVEEMIRQRDCPAHVPIPNGWTYELDAHTRIERVVNACAHCGRAIIVGERPLPAWGVMIWRGQQRVYPP